MFKANILVIKPNNVSTLIKYFLGNENRQCWSSVLQVFTNPTITTAAKDKLLPFLYRKVNTSQPRTLVAAFLPLRSGFSPKLIHVGLAVEEMALGQAFCRYVGLSLSFIIPSTLGTRLSLQAGTVDRSNTAVPGDSNHIHKNKIKHPNNLTFLQIRLVFQCLCG